MQKTNRGGKISRKVILSHLHNAEGYDHDLKDENAWRVFGVAIKDIKVLHADTFRRISKSGEKDHTKVNYQWKPTVVIQAGKHTLNTSPAPFHLGSSTMIPAFSLGVVRRLRLENSRQNS